MAIPAIGVVPPIMPTPVAAPIGGAGSIGTTGAASGTGFANALTNVVDNLQGLQSNADNLAVQAANGTLQNPHDYLLAANQASLTTQMTVAVRNKALEAFNEIMRMPL